MPEKEKKDPTRNQRQSRRRERERRWLKAHGWRSWEALHTSLMNGSTWVISRKTETPHLQDNLRISDITDQG
jgi:hypothetical protein